MSNEAKLPLVYSCSGASSAAQMANHIAVRLDRLKAAEMSCIAGVGDDVKPLVRTAKSGGPIIALDGCPLHCAARILKRHGINADKHYDLSEMGVKKEDARGFRSGRSQVSLPADRARLRARWLFTGHRGNYDSGIRTGKRRAYIPAGFAKRNRGGSARTHQPGVLLKGIQRLVASGIKRILMNLRLKCI